MRPSVIGVATSVGWNGRTYDTLDALAYAQAHDFSPVQVYLNPELLADAALRRQVVEQAAAAGIRLLGHAPALLNDGPGTAPAVNAAALDLLRAEADRWVVHHFDEKLPVETAVRCVQQLLADGLTPCVENFHTLPGPAAARQHYVYYHELFHRLKRLNLTIPAVIDIPRFFAPDLGLTSTEASDLAVQVLHELAGLGVPILFHLVDSSVRDFADRRCWCPVGAGVIGYADLLPRIFAADVRTLGVVLEFDDQENPLPSRQFLQQWFSPFLTKEGKSA